MKKTPIVTKDGLKEMLYNPNQDYVKAVIGRALVVLFYRQTKIEKQINEANVHNDLGFTHGDAHSGCITAKYFIKHKTLDNWQVEKWLRTDKHGYPRICKYHKQLNEIAEESAKNKAELKKESNDIMNKSDKEVKNDFAAYEAEMEQAAYMTEMEKN